MGGRGKKRDLNKNKLKGKMETQFYKWRKEEGLERRKGKEPNKKELRRVIHMCKFFMMSVSITY